METRHDNPTSLRARFMAHVVPADDTPDTCWNWVGARHNYSGTGLFRVAKGGPGGIWPAHRVSWVLDGNGPLLGWQRLEPRCGNRLCVRGSHHQLVKKSRRRPTHVKHHTRERKAEVLALVDAGLGIADAVRSCGIERRTLTRWLREQRKRLNGAPTVVQGETYA